MPQEQHPYQFYFTAKVERASGDGFNNPIGRNGEIRHGTYYLDEDFEWQFFEWQEGKNDSGIVLIIREAGNVEVAAFVYSGRATNAIGNALRKYSASTPSSFNPACSHMNKYSSHAGLNEPGALSKHLQFSGWGCFQVQPEYLLPYCKNLNNSGLILILQ